MEEQGPDYTDMIKEYEREQDVRDDIDLFMRDHFDIQSEVTGRHLIENKGVRIDFMLKPKGDFLQNGFPDCWVGVECKYFDIPAYPDVNKVSRLVSQCIDYVHSEFETRLDGLVRPKYIMTYTNSTCYNPLTSEAGKLREVARSDANPEWINALNAYGIKMSDKGKLLALRYLGHRFNIGQLTTHSDGTWTMAVNQILYRSEDSHTASNVTVDRKIGSA